MGVRQVRGCSCSSTKVAEQVQGSARHMALGWPWQVWLWQAVVREQGTGSMLAADQYGHNTRSGGEEGSVSEVWGRDIKMYDIRHSGLYSPFIMIG